MATFQHYYKFNIENKNLGGPPYCTAIWEAKTPGKFQISEWKNGVYSFEYKLLMFWKCKVAVSKL